MTIVAGTSARLRTLLFQPEHVSQEYGDSYKGLNQKIQPVHIGPLTIAEVNRFKRFHPACTVNFKECLGIIGHVIKPVQKLPLDFAMMKPHVRFAVVFIANYKTRLQNFVTYQNGSCYHYR